MDDDSFSLRPTDVIMTGVKAELRTASPRPPMRMQVTRVQGAILCDPDTPGRTVFTMDYRLCLIDSIGTLVTGIDLSLAFPCVVVSAAGAAVTSGQLRAYAATHLYAYAHDYLREHLHWLTSAMGLVPLIIEPFTRRDGENAATLALANSS